MENSNYDLSKKDFKISNNGNVYIKTNMPGMLLIYANWCGHCKSFMPLFNEIKRDIGHKFSCLSIENSQLEIYPELSKALDFSYFPTIKFFDQNGKIISTYPENLNREKDDILNYICKMYHRCKQ
jgi:thiol-disulfide isomerase/thioredoxin